MEAATQTPENETAAAPAPPPRLRDQYEEKVLPELTKKFGYSTPMSAPRLLKVTVNMGIGEASRAGSVVDDAIAELSTITGQRPNLRRARKSIAAFKLREGMPVGVAVTLRKARMWEFTDRLVSISIPRIRDFRGLNPRSFDGRGNYTLGIREQLIFPEIDYDSVKETRGLDITFATSAANDEEGFELLLGLGFPFAKEGRPGGKPLDEIAAEEEEHRKEEARAAGRGRAGRPRAAQGREPRGLREAGDRRGRRWRRRRGIRFQRWKRRGVDGKDLTTREAAGGLEVQGPQLQPLPQVRPLPRGLPQVRPVPDLPARSRPQGLRPRHDEVELVTEMLTDPIADYLTRVRNALRADHPEVEVPASRLKKEMSRILVEQGYVNSYEVEPTSVGESIKISLKYTEDRDPVIQGMRRISRPGRRRYVGGGEVPRVQGGMGTAIISTSTGVMTGHEAKEKGVGGEVIAYVW